MFETHGRARLRISVEPVMWIAEGITSQPYRTSSIITRCRSAGLPPVRSWRAAICW